MQYHKTILLAVICFSTLFVGAQTAQLEKEQYNKYKQHYNNSMHQILDVMRVKLPQEVDLFRFNEYQITEEIDYQKMMEDLYKTANNRIKTGDIATMDKSVYKAVNMLDSLPPGAYSNIVFFLLLDKKYNEAAFIENIGKIRSHQYVIYSKDRGYAEMMGIMQFAGGGSFSRYYQQLDFKNFRRNLLDGYKYANKNKYTYLATNVDKWNITAEQLKEMDKENLKQMDELKAKLDQLKDDKDFMLQKHNALSMMHTFGVKLTDEDQKWYTEKEKEVEAAENKKMNEMMYGMEMPPEKEMTEKEKAEREAMDAEAQAMVDEMFAGLEEAMTEATEEHAEEGATEEHAEEEATEYYYEEYPNETEQEKEERIKREKEEYAHSERRDELRYEEYQAMEKLLESPAVSVKNKSINGQWERHVNLWYRFEDGYSKEKQGEKPKEQSKRMTEMEAAEAEAQKMVEEMLAELEKEMDGVYEETTEGEATEEIVDHKIYEYKDTLLFVLNEKGVIPTSWDIDALNYMMQQPVSLKNELEMKRQFRPDSVECKIDYEANPVLITMVLHNEESKPRTMYFIAEFIAEDTIKFGKPYFNNHSKFVVKRSAILYRK